MAAAESFFVTRTMQALEVLAFQPSSASQIASHLRVDARTARRLLNRLTEDGWVVRVEGRVRTYTLSLRLLALAAVYADSLPLAHAAQPLVTGLHTETACTAHLEVPCYRSVLCLVHRAGGPDARPQLRELVSAHACAGGKVLLAYREPWRESVLERPLDELTDRTVVEPDEVRRQCAEIRERGWATEDGEYRIGLQGVAAPVFDHTGEAVAALALTGGEELRVLDRLDAVKAAAAELSGKRIPAA
jgi:DNA-binding IclR family transcriptional regulator